jgi:hypothetical protein
MEIESLGLRASASHLGASSFTCLTPFRAATNTLTANPTLSFGILRIVNIELISQKLSLNYSPLISDIPIQIDLSYAIQLESR